MRILNENNVEITSPDLKLGKLVDETILVKHHEAIEAVEEVGHYEVVAEYPNGGKDVEWIIDVEGVEAAEAWDEYEDILRYVLYTEEELAKIEAEKNKPTTQSDTDAMLIDHEYRLTLLELFTDMTV